MPPRRGSSSSLLSPPVLIILLPTIILLFIIYAIPPLLSLTYQLLQPTVSVKKSWDSLNVFLVIFAILCGVFSRKHDDGVPDPDDDHVRIYNHNASDPLLNRTTSSPQESVLLPHQQLFGYSERTSKTYDTPVRTPENVVFGGRLTRRSSYPDLRQVESLWQTLDDVQTNKSQFRFFDDFEISNYRTHRHYKETSSDDVKEIQVDTCVLQSSPPPAPKPPSASPPPPPPPPPRREKQRTYETISRRKVEEVKVEEVRSTPPLTPPPPPPPPPRPVAPPSPMRVRSDQKGRLERRKSNVKKEIAMVWNSVLSNQRKRKRKQKATRNIYDTATEEPPPDQSQPPPPPPPPPPSSVFHNLFKKGSKTKKVHSVSTTAPTPPPPPPPAVSVHKHQTRTTMPPPAQPNPPRHPPSAHSRRRPPLPTKPSTYYEDNVINSGCQSPLIPIPPPPPPFKMPELKFFVKGDFVKIRSNQSSRCGSPEPDDALPAGKEEESESSSTVKMIDGGDGIGRASPSVFCPSPDVNTKADNFIARLRDEWRLEKLNSLREKKTK